MNRSQTESLPLAEVDPVQARALAQSIKRFGFNFDRFDDPLMYPPAAEDPPRVALFFFFLVAIDHRTNTQGKTYTGIVNGVQLTGAELMYALAMKRFEQDHSFFTAERMSRVSSDEIVSLFRVTEPQTIDIAGPEERAILLRDCGLKLQREFDGSVLRMISKSGGYLLSSDGNGLLQLLSRFNAYQDPLRKKPFLLTKFLERRHLISLNDPENLHVPVDNIIQRLALRTGVIKLMSSEVENKIRNDIEVDPVEEEAIRNITMQAFDEVARNVGLSAVYLDDILWEFGRIHCRVPIPFCDGLPESRRAYRIIKSGPVGECPFGPGCKSYRDASRWKLKEPRFKTIFY
jgi:hypothetical protein